MRISQTTTRFHAALTLIAVVLSTALLFAALASPEFVGAQAADTPTPTPASETPDDPADPGTEKTEPAGSLAGAPVKSVVDKSGPDTDNDLIGSSSKGTLNTISSNLTHSEGSGATGRIAFYSDRDGDLEIYVMNADGSNVTQLTHNPAYDGVPGWSPDGSRIAFHSDRDGDHEIYVMNADGSNVTQLTYYSADDRVPRWSPDGRRIAFYSDRDGDEEIYVMNADGSNVTQLTYNSAEEYDPSWSPDGERIAFFSDRDGDYEIYATNADGSNVTQLTHNQAVDGVPYWSPDGRRIAFHSDRDGDLEIYVMNADGSNVTQLTHNPADDFQAHWSPDGEHFVFLSERDGDPEIYVMDTDGSNVTQLTHNDAVDWAPQWSPTEGSVVVPPPAVSCEETLTSDGAVSGRWSSDCTSENRSGSYARYYNFTLTDSADVTITLESSVDTYLFLLDGDGRVLDVDDDDDDDEFALASSTDSGLRRTLPAGTYTIEATTFYTGVTGTFILTVNGLAGDSGGTENDPLNGDRVFLNSATLNGQTIDNANPSLTVAAGQAISGTVNLTVHNDHGSHAVFPVEATPTWGDHETSFWRVPIHPSAFGSTQGNASIALTAPSTPGTYAIIFAAQAELSGGYVMSATHWPSGPPRWNNGDDVAGWSDEQIGFAIANGYVRAPQYGWGQPTNHFGATAVRIVVTSEPEPPAVSCEETLTGVGAVSGSWSSDCASENRPGSYARYFTFTLTESAEVIITLRSEEDTYLFLVEGAGSDGSVLDQDDDDDHNQFALPSSTDSGLRNSLSAGTYTIEATTFNPRVTGLFLLTLSGFPTGATPEPTITFGDLNWESAMLQTRIAQYIVEKGYGYPSAVRFGAPVPLFQALRAGNIDVLMEVWLPNQEEAWEAALAEGAVSSPGTSLGTDWESAFVIPRYLQEQYPDLDSVEDLKEDQYRSLFVTDATDGKARLMSCVIGWVCEVINVKQIEAYGLSDHVHIVTPGDQQELNTDLIEAYENEEPWLGYQWGTNDTALLLDLERLEEPAYSDECWATTMACAYEDSTILVAVNAELPDSAPDFVDVLTEWDFNVDGVYKPVFRWQANNPDANTEDAAMWWLRENSEIWSEWVTEDAGAAIGDALDRGEFPDGWPEEPSVTPDPTPTPEPPESSCTETLTGDGAVSGSWGSGCASENRSGSYARYYTFTLTEAAEVSITLESGVDTYLFLLDGAGRVLNVDDDDDDNQFTLASDTDSGLKRTLSAGAYTIEATTYHTGATGPFTLTVNGIGGVTPPPPLPVSCEVTLTGDGAVRGRWSNDCASENRSGSYARYYTFILTESAEVSITLESSEDAYLFLLDGDGRDGSVLDQDDDDDHNQFTLASSTDSGLRMTLPAGTYTIEATTYNPRITETFTLTVSGLETVTPPATDGDYDIDNDGLIEISVLEQLNAIRWDLDGDGIVDSSITDSQPYLAAFPDAVTGMGCPSNECNGYELSRDLDFLDTASYASGSVNTNWTQGDGWLPINGVDARFSARFDGNAHTISNLYINRSSNGVGLFGATVMSSSIMRVGVVDVDITGASYVGGLVGQNWGTITASYSTGSTKGAGGFLAKNDYIGGLAGSNGLVTPRGSTTSLGGTIVDCYSTASVEGNNLIGGLVGHNYGRVVTSYATGSVKGGDEIGGLIGATNDIGILNNILLEFDPSRNGRIISSYATGSVEGDSNIGGLVGEVNADPGVGLVGNVDAISSIETSYATGSVQGNENAGGLIGKLAPGRFLVGTVVKIESSYWDYLTTGQRSGIGLVDGASPGGTSLVEGKTTEELQSPTGYSGIYETWDDEGDVWDFGTSTQYPALKADINGDGTATWEEFGDQR